MLNSKKIINPNPQTHLDYWNLMQQAKTKWRDIEAEPSALTQSMWGIEDKKNKMLSQYYSQLDAKAKKSAKDVGEYDIKINSMIRVRK